MEENSTPLSLVFNLDQTSSKYLPVFTKTAPKGSKTLPKEGFTDKRMITETFTRTIDGSFFADAAYIQLHN